MHTRVSAARSTPLENEFLKGINIEPTGPLALALRCTCEALQAACRQVWLSPKGFAMQDSAERVCKQVQATQTNSAWRPSPSAWLLAAPWQRPVLPAKLPLALA